MHYNMIVIFTIVEGTHPDLLELTHDELMTLELQMINIDANSEQWNKKKYIKTMYQKNTYLKFVKKMLLKYHTPISNFFGSRYLFLYFRIFNRLKIILIYLILVLFLFLIYKLIYIFY